MLYDLICSLNSFQIVIALDPRGDQAHFGPVLALFHRAWLLELENSILAVDSSIEALPYWDYSRDVAPLKSNYTSIFSAKYFGSYVGEAPDYSIIDGEFGHWPILKDTDTNEPLLHKNVYGYQRHPLSLNKSPYLTRRGGSICGYNIGLGDPQMWNLCLNSGDSISDWTACVDSRIHGPAHSSIAGSWRRDGQTSDSPFCAQWFGYIAPPVDAKLLNATSDTRYPFGTFINPYALNCFDCPTCDITQNPNSCICTPHGAKGICGPLWTSLVNSTQATYLRGGSVNNLSSDTKNSITLADSAQIQILGDMGDPSASPNDPL